MNEPLACYRGLPRLRINVELMLRPDTGPFYRSATNDSFDSPVGY